MKIIFHTPGNQWLEKNWKEKKEIHDEFLLAISKFAAYSCPLSDNIHRHKHIQVQVRVRKLRIKGEFEFLNVQNSSLWEKKEIGRLAINAGWKSMENVKRKEKMFLHLIPLKLLRRK